MPTDSLGKVFTGLILALLLLGLGGLGIRGVKILSPVPPPNRILLIGIKGFSWTAALDLARTRPASILGAWLRTGSARGDLAVASPDFSPRMLSALASGKLSAAPELISLTKDKVSTGDNSTGTRLIWNRLNRRGDAVGVVGFPLWLLPMRKNALVFPDGESAFSGFFYFQGGERQEASREWSDLVIEAQNIPPALMNSVLGKLPSSPLRLETLQSCLASDRYGTIIAEKLLRDEEKRKHVFVYLSGLGRWHEELKNQTSEPTLMEKEQLLGYYDFLDRELRSLARYADEYTTMIIFSEPRSDAAVPEATDASLPGETKGFFLARGFGIKREVELGGISPTDLNATILYLTDLPLPVDQEGGVIFSLLEDEYYFSHRLAFTR